MLAAVATSCEPGETSYPSVGEIGDSSGVTIVRHRAAPPEQLPVWRVTEQTVVDERSAGDAGRFGTVTDVALGADALYVLDAMAREVRVFDLYGSHLRTVGGPGDGPGELSRFATSLFLGRDSLTVADWGHARLHHYDREGRHLGSTALSGGAARSWWRGGADGRLYLRSLERYVDDASAWRGRDLLVRAEDGGTVLETVHTFVYPETDLGGPGRPALPLVVNAPTWDVLPDGTIAWSTLEERRIYLQSPLGGVDRVIEAEEWIRRAPTAEEERALLGLMGDKLVSVGGSRETVEQLDARQPEALPAITSVRAGPNGTLLVQRMGRVEDVHPMGLNSPDPPAGWGGPLWDVFTRSGERLAILDLGPRVRVTRFTDSHVVGVRRDDLDRDQVVLWTFVWEEDEGDPGA